MIRENWENIKSNEPGRQKLGSLDGWKSWQQMPCAKLYSDLLQAENEETLIALGSHQGEFKIACPMGYCWRWLNCLFLHNVRHGDIVVSIRFPCPALIDWYMLQTQRQEKCSKKCIMKQNCRWFVWRHTMKQDKLKGIVAILLFSAIWVVFSVTANKSWSNSKWFICIVFLFSQSEL